MIFGASRVGIVEIRRREDAGSREGAENGNGERADRTWGEGAYHDVICSWYVRASTSSVQRRDQVVKTITAFVSCPIGLENGSRDLDKLAVLKTWTVFSVFLSMESTFSRTGRGKVPEEIQQGRQMTMGMSTGDL